MRESGITQSDLSRISGVRQPSISQFLSGRIEMSDDMLNRLLSCLGYRLEVVRRPVRVELDRFGGTLGNKIRNAEMQKVPFMFIVGDKEQEAGAVAVRDREKGDLGPQPLDEAIGVIKAQNVPGGATG